MACGPLSAPVSSAAGGGKSGVRDDRGQTRRQGEATNSQRARAVDRSVDESWRMAERFARFSFSAEAVSAGCEISEHCYAVTSVDPTTSGKPQRSEGAPDSQESHRRDALRAFLGTQAQRAGECSTTKPSQEGSVSGGVGQRTYANKFSGGRLDAHPGIRVNRSSLNPLPRTGTLRPPSGRPASCIKEDQ